MKLAFKRPFILQAIRFFSSHSSDAHDWVDLFSSLFSVRFLASLISFDALHEASALWCSAWFSVVMCVDNITVRRACLFFMVDFAASFSGIVVGFQDLADVVAWFLLTLEFFRLSCYVRARPQWSICLPVHASVR